MGSSITACPRRVVVTGMSTISPAGNTLEDYWQGLVSGKSFVRNVTRFDTSELGIHTAGEVDLGALANETPRSTLQRPDISIQFGLLAAQGALDQAGLLQAARDGVRIATMLGTGLGPCNTLADCYEIYSQRGIRGVRPTTVPRCMYNGLASEASIVFHLTGRQTMTAAACASASLAIGQAFETIRAGQEDVVLAGGSDSPLTPSIYCSWVNLRVLASHENPEKAMRPFDKARDGFVLSEGAGMVVLEELEHAKARGATIYGEVLAHGTASDAMHITKPDKDGQVAALRRALRLADVAPEEVDYINAHGTSTVLNDQTETAAIKETFGDCARKIPVSSTKSVIGHTMGASAALEVIAILLAMRHSVLPPTVNYETPDPECDLDYVPNEARPGRIRTALSNSFAFGGSNSVLVIRAYEEA